MFNEGDIIFTDRYRALSIPYPDSANMCQGHCVGTGHVPVHREEVDPIYKQLFEEAERVNPNKPGDDWHVVRCPICSGTGRRQ